MTTDKASDTVMVLRTNTPDGLSYGGFRWPETGPVACKDWRPNDRCGNGLHGLLWGVGDASLLRGATAPHTVWRVVEVAVADVIDLGGKVKFPRGTVVYCGDQGGALAYLDEHGAAGMPVVYSTRAAGDQGTATAGYRGTATAGYRGTATAGYRGTATAGDWGTATAGDRGTATAGYRGTATAGYRGTATAGDWGTATAGYRGTATAGDRGVLIITWYDEHNGRCRRAIGQVGVDGIQPNTPYRYDTSISALVAVDTAEQVA